MYVGRRNYRHSPATVSLSIPESAKQPAWLVTDRLELQNRALSFYSSHHSTVLFRQNLTCSLIL